MIYLIRSGDTTVPAQEISRRTLHNKPRATKSVSSCYWKHFNTLLRSSKFLPPLLKSIPSLFPNPPPNLIANITRILEVNTTKDPAVAIVLDSLLDARSPPGDDLLNARHITAQLYVNLITAVPQADDRASSSAKSGVRAQVVLMVGRWVEERFPCRVCEAGVGRKVDGGIVVESGDWSPTIVVVFGVPGCDGGVGESVV
jgi:hypothetical protein